LPRVMKEDTTGLKQLNLKSFLLVMPQSAVKMLNKFSILGLILMMSSLDRCTQRHMEISPQENRKREIITGTLIRQNIDLGMESNGY